MSSKWMREHGLLLVNAGLFLVFFAGMILTGAANYSQEQQAHGEAAVSVLAFLATGDFVEATFENWESEFLQMAMYVVLTAFLFQRGSSESKPVGKDAPQDEDPRQAAIKKATPWPVKRGGAVLKVYEHSLSILLFVLFVGSFTAHAFGGAAAYNEEQESHGEAGVSVIQYVGTSRFWFESFQNWQSEFLSVLAIVVLTIFLREKGSPQSKPVDETNEATGE